MPKEIKDDQLRMMFSCCHARLPEESQGALILHILCGFSVDEIANAFVSSHAATGKRITRAKKVLARSKKLFDVTAPKEFAARLPAVQQALYLLFNEGYHVASPEAAVRSELCHEAMRLTAMLLDHPLGATPATHALAALMCLNAARLPARVDVSGNLHALVDQDRSSWDRNLVAEGLKLMELSATGSELTEFHVESAIAAVHATAPRTVDTDWAKIVSLYDTLMTIRPSPVVALNRAIAIAERDGPERGLDAIPAIADGDRLSTIRSTQQRSANLSYAAGGTRPRMSISRRRSPSRVIRWSVPFSNSAQARAKNDRTLNSIFWVLALPTPWIEPKGLLCIVMRNEQDPIEDAGPRNSELARAASMNLNVSVSTGVFPGRAPLGVWTLQTTHPRTYFWCLN
jgi:predicted RNA polymerase sigma factor